VFLLVKDKLGFFPESSCRQSNEATSNESELPLIKVTILVLLEEQSYIQTASKEDANLHLLIPKVLINVWCQSSLVGHQRFFVRIWCGLL
jgi:hypothetical protein